MVSIASKPLLKRLPLRCISNNCNNGTRGLPDIYAQSARVADPMADGIHIGQIMSTHVTSNVYHFQQSKNHLYLHCSSLRALHIYIATGSYDYGIVTSMSLHDVYLCNAL